MLIVWILFAFFLFFAMTAAIFAKIILFFAAAACFGGMVCSIKVVTYVNHGRQMEEWASSRSDLTRQCMSRPDWMQIDSHSETNSRNTVTNTATTAFNNCTFNNCTVNRFERCTVYLVNGGTNTFSDHAAQNALPANSGYSEIPAAAPQYSVAAPAAQIEEPKKVW